MVDVRTFKMMLDTRHDLYYDLNSIFIEGQKEFINSDVFTKLIEVDKYYVSFLNEQDGRK